MHPPARVIQRFETRYVRAADGCWHWTGARNGVGYGRISWHEESGKQVWALAHRVAYVIAYGQVPEGMDLDHQCHDPLTCDRKGDDCTHRRCVNPEHLVPLTRRENLLRGGTVAARRASTTACPQGHEYTPENTWVDKKGRRECRECRRAKNRAYYWQNRTRRLEYNKRLRESKKRQIP